MLIDFNYFNCSKTKSAQYKSYRILTSLFVISKPLYFVSQTISQRLLMQPYFSKQIFTNLKQSFEYFIGLYKFSKYSLELSSDIIFDSFIKKALLNLIFRNIDLPDKFIICTNLQRVIQNLIILILGVCMVGLKLFSFTFYNNIGVVKGKF